MPEKVEWPHVGLTVDEAAASLRVDRKAIFKAIQEGGLPARKVGKGYRISLAAMEAWLASENTAEVYGRVSIGTPEPQPEDDDGLPF